MTGPDVEDIYQALVELGEDVSFFQKGIKQKAAFTPNRLNKAIATTDGAYWYNGNMTFDNMHQQEMLSGEYFKRASQPNVTLMLYGVFPCPYDERIADIHCVECNEKVDLITHYEDTGEQNEFGEPIMAPHFSFRDVDVYITMFPKDARTSSVGNLEETITYLTIPAKYTVSGNTVIMKDTFVFNEDTKRNELKKMPYQVESIDTSMMDIVDGNIVGTLRCMMKEKQ